MEIPVDPVLMRGISLLLSKNPESSRQLIDLMTEHNGMTATMVDVWLGSGPPKVRIYMFHWAIYGRRFLAGFCVMNKIS